MAGALHRGRDLALVLGAGAGLPPRADVPFLGDVTPEKIHVFIVDYDRAIGAKLANTRLGVKAPGRSAGCRGFVLVIVAHDLIRS